MLFEHRHEVRAAYELNRVMPVYKPPRDNDLVQGTHQGGGPGFSTPAQVLSSARASDPWLVGARSLRTQEARVPFQLERKTASEALQGSEHREQGLQAAELPVLPILYW